VTEARRRLSTIVERVQHQADSYVISRYGRPAAAVVPLAVYENRQRRREAFFDLVRDLKPEADLSPEEADRVAREAIAAIRPEG
jgi:prevent-host-death family protein